jgi:hypothetical protein
MIDMLRISLYQYHQNVDEHINQWLIDSNYAVPYYGRTKTRPSSWGTL